MIEFVLANALAVPLPAESVQMIATSPPYFGLRDYNVAGQIGLEGSPQEYIANLMSCAREWWRVLRPDGVLFLNLGDSYFGSNQTGGKDGKEGSVKRSARMFKKPSNGQRAISCDTSDKAPVNSQGRDCLCGNLCDVCRVVYRNRKSHSDNLLVAMLVASLSESNRAHMESVFGHPPTLDSSHPEDHTANAILDSLHSQDREVEQLRASLVSMIGESYPQLLDACLLRANRGECLLCARSLGDYAQKCVDTSSCPCAKHSDSFSKSGPFENNQNTVSIDGASVFYNSGMASYSDVSHPHSTIPSLKHKDLMMIPARIAIALQDDGWYLRSEIVWAKPNPMPEPVGDRPTRAHEMIYLLAKQRRYYYDAEAVREPLSETTRNDPRMNDMGRTYNGKGRGAYGEEGKANGSMQAWTLNPNGRNLRDVWTITPQSYRGAHFATWPEKLVEIMVKAGSRPGDLVLDPFSGSGTTGRVCARLGRRFVGLDLNPEYFKLASERTDRVQMTTDAVGVNS